MGATGPLVSVTCSGYYRTVFKIIHVIASSACRNFMVLRSVLDVLRLSFLHIKALFSIVPRVVLVHCKLLFLTIHRHTNNYDKLEDFNRNLNVGFVVCQCKEI